MQTISSRSFFLLASFVLSTSFMLAAQDIASAPVVPHVVKYSGSLPNAPAAASVVEVKFSLYATQTGGGPLWSETQQVTLDPQGRYAVLLGATAPGGLPDALFAAGAAKWLGVTLAGDDEPSRTLLSANAYALKANDAETLGGHPISDFKLATNANGKPDTAVDVTSITAGTGITVLNNGTASPTVEINSTYLDNLAAGYAPLAGNNTFTGANKFANTTVAGNLTVTGTFTNTALGAFAATLPVLTSANTFTKANTFNGQVNINNVISQNYALNGYIATLTNTGTSGSGLNVVAPGTGLRAVGTNTATGAQPIGIYGTTLGTNGVGIYGSQPIQGGAGAGIYGVLGTFSTIGNLEAQQYGSPAVWADASDTTSGASGSIALYATSDTDSAAIVANYNPDFYALYIQTSSGSPFRTYDTTSQKGCSIDNEGDLTCDGSVTGSITPLRGGPAMAVHAITSPENWIEDAGGGSIASGVGHVDLEQRFLGTVNTGMDYHVFLTPEGDCKGLYVANKTASGFDVRELGGGRASIAFSYRIMAKRVGMENARLEDLTKQQEMLERQRAPRSKKIARPVQNPPAPRLSPVAGAR